MKITFLGGTETVTGSKYLLSFDNHKNTSDYAELLEWLKHFRSAPKKIFMTHGEPAAALSLKNKIMEHLGWNAIVPHHEQSEMLL